MQREAVLVMEAKPRGPCRREGGVAGFMHWSVQKNTMKGGFRVPSPEGVGRAKENNSEGLANGTRGK